MILLDINYGRSKTWALDLRIIAVTIPSIIVEIYQRKRPPRTASALGAKAADPAPARSAGAPGSIRSRPNRAAPASSF